MRFRTVIFDLDDTLYPEWEYVRSGFNAVERFLVDSGVPECDGLAERWYRTRRSGERRVFDLWAESGERAALHALDAFGPPAGLAATLVTVFRSHEPVIGTFDGIHQLLATLASPSNDGCRIGMVSDGLLDVQRAKLRALGLQHYFHSVVFSDELGRECWKPSPRPFMEVLARLSRPPDRAVYVADNPLKDFVGARAVGLSTIRFRAPGGVYAPLEPATSQHMPDHEVLSVAALASLLAGA